MTDELFQIAVKPLGIVNDEEANRLLIEHWNSIHTDKIAPIYQEHYVLVLEVKKIGEDSLNMINVPFIGKRAELETWLKTFIEPLEKVVKNFIEDIFGAFYSDIVQPSMQKGASEPTKVVIKHKDAILKAKNEAMDYANFLVDSVKENTCTTNDHYLTATTQEFETRFTEGFPYLNDDYKLSMQSYFHVACGLRAFFKTRKKVLPDTTQLHFTKAMKDLLKETVEVIEDKIILESSIAMIKESPRSVARRNLYLKKEERIKHALAEIELL